MDFVRQRFLLLRLILMTFYLALFLPPSSQEVTIGVMRMC